MRLYDPNLEFDVLKTICTPKNDKERASLVTGVDKTWFYDDAAIKIYKRIRNLITATGSIPSWKELTTDPGLAESAREAIKDKGTIKAFKKTKIEAAHSRLSKYRKARLLLDMAKLVSDGLDTDDPDIDNILTKATDKLASSHSDGFHNRMTVVGANGNDDDLLQEILDNKRPPVVPTGFSAFDDQNGGFLKGSLVILAATTGGGKSTMAHVLMANMAQRGHKSCLMSMEMSERSVYGRMMSRVADISATKFLYFELTKNEKKQAKKRWNKFRSELKRLGSSMRIWEPQEDTDIVDALTTIGMYDLDVVFIDYLGLLKGVDGDDQWRQLGNAARHAKLWAERNNKVVVLLAQLNDTGEIKYSRAIKEHSDNAWVWTMTDDEKNEGVMTVRQAKARNQKTFDMVFTVNFEKMSMESTRIGNDGHAVGTTKVNEDGEDIDSYLNKAG